MFKKGSDTRGIRKVYEECGDLSYAKEENGAAVAVIRLPLLESPNKE